MKKIFYDVNTVGKTLTWTILLPIILSFVAEIVLIILAGMQQTTLEELLKSTAVIICVAMLSQVAFGLVFWRVNKNVNVTRACKIYPKIGIRNIIICVLVALIVNFGIGPIVNCFSSLLSWMGYELSGDLPFTIDSPIMLIVSILLIALVPAVVEELLFRGVILQGLRKYGDKIAIIVSSALFALVHLSAEQLLFPFIFGLILAYFVIKTGSIVSSMIMHFVSNATSLLLYYFNVNIIIDVDMILYVLIAVALLAVTLVIAYFAGKLTRNVEKETPSAEVIEMLDNPQLVQTVDNSTNLLRYGIILGVVIWVMNFVYSMII